MGLSFFACFGRTSNYRSKFVWPALIVAEERMLNLKKSLVYLAGPITGASYGDNTDWRVQISDMLPDCIEPISPMRGKTYLRDESAIADEYTDSVLSCSRGIMSRDYNDVKRADALIVNFLDAGRASLGSVMEIAWAYAMQKPVILVIEKTGNLHDHAMIREATGFRVDNLEDAAHIATRLLMTGV